MPIQVCYIIECLRYRLKYNFAFKPNTMIAGSRLPLGVNFGGDYHPGASVILGLLVNFSKG